MFWSRLPAGLAAILIVATTAAAGECRLIPAQATAALNLLRAHGQRCGGITQAAAPALRWDDRLAASAGLFAEELARRDTLSHEGHTSKTLRDRLRAAAYAFRSAGENLAAGPDSLDEVIDQWLASADHCENLMQPNFRDVGLACVPGTGRYDHFWVLHLGRSREATDPVRSSPDRSP